MRATPKKGLAAATLVYWFLLVYIIAALVWWFVALQQQNHQMTAFKLLELQPNDPGYLTKANAITNEENRKNAQYIGEGLTFLLLIIIGAVFVFRAVRRELKLSSQQQNFMMAVTHELKTPIAVAKLNLETLLKHKLDETRQNKLIQATLEEANRLNNLSSNILLSAQLEDGGYTITREELDLSALVTASVADFKRRFPDRHINPEIHAELEMKGDNLLLQMLVNNLIDNAIKYSPKDGTIAVSLDKKSNSILLKVSDQGAGIPKEEEEKIFERFYRIGNEQVRTTRGTGLGLYLCSRIAEDHNATITISRNQPTGSIFTVQFRP